MVENTWMKDIQADIKRMTETLTSHNMQFLKVNQTVKLMLKVYEGATNVGFYCHLVTSAWRGFHISLSLCRWVKFPEPRYTSVILCAEATSTREGRIS